MAYSRKDLRSYRRIRVTKTGTPLEPWEVSFWHPIYDQPCVYRFRSWQTAMALARIVGYAQAHVPGALR